MNEPLWFLAGFLAGVVLTLLVASRELRALAAQRRAHVQELETFVRLSRAKDVSPMTRA